MVLPALNLANGKLVPHPQAERRLKVHKNHGSYP